MADGILQEEYQKSQRKFVSNGLGTYTDEKITKYYKKLLKVEEPWEYYYYLLSNDTFQVLFLEKKTDISDEEVKHNYMELRGFLTKLSGRENERVNVSRDYPGLEVEYAMERLNYCYNELSESEKRKALLALMQEEKRNALREKILEDLRIQSENGKICDSEKEFLIKKGNKLGLSTDPVEEYIGDFIKEHPEIQRVEQTPIVVKGDEAFVYVEGGTFQMRSNVWEWCEDWYGDYPSSDQTNPKGPISGSSRVLRGGSWGNVGGACRVANRNGSSPDYGSRRYGFRLVLDK